MLWLLYILIFTVVNICLFVFLDSVQPKQYMDEAFHIPQAKQYCSSNFSVWDPMITTPPGLYLMSVGLLKPWSFITQTDISNICSVFWLRFTNVLFTTGNAYLVYALTRKIHGNRKEATTTGLALSAFPVLYFFTFLYYTDSGSVFFVLLMYIFCLHENHKIAATMGVVSIFFRQTNVVWVVCVAGQTIGKRITEWMSLSKREIALSNDSDILKLFGQLFWQALRSNCRSLLYLFSCIIGSVWCYILVGIGFAIFVYMNEGLVLGDRSHHEACLNFPQIFYYLCTVMFFSFPHIISPSKVLNCMKFMMQSPFKIILFFSVSYYFISKYTYVHEYLLADNRHYTFYVWSKIYRRYENIKFYLIPVYFHAAYGFISCLKNKDIFWKMVFCICILLSTVPQKLLEFRYFIIPYIIFRINIETKSSFAVFLEFLSYVVINILILYIYVKKPIVWDNLDDPQRIMW